MNICGIDEAGRGPLIGPLVLAGVLIDEKDEKKLKDLEVKDSKLLTKEKRDELFDAVKNVVSNYEIIIVPASEVDDAVFGKKGLNLNKLEAVKTAEIINKMIPEKAIVDAPSNNISAYTSYLRERLNKKSTELVAEHKADMIYPVVSAASILAKVTRDNEIEQMKKEIGIDFGSGYMSDQKTADFLETHYEEYGDIIRKSWSSYKNVVEKKHQSTLDGFGSGENKREGEVSKDIQEKIDGIKEKLSSLNYQEIETKGTYEAARFKGACTVTVYTSGKVLVQGKEEDKSSIEKLLGL